MKIQNIQETLMNAYLNEDVW